MGGVQRESELSVLRPLGHQGLVELANELRDVEENIRQAIAASPFLIGHLNDELSVGFDAQAFLPSAFEDSDSDVAICLAVARGVLRCLV